MSGTLVYLIRHTEPVLPDDRKRFVGWSDPPLSPNGVRQAHMLAKRLGHVRFDSIWSSDLRRCALTAEIIAGGAARGPQSRTPTALDASVRVQPDPQLREINAGLFEGLTFEEAAATHPQEYAERERDLVGYRFPGGESFRDLRARALAAFLRIVDRGGAKVLVVSHLGVNRVLLCEFLGLPLEDLFSIKQAYGHVNLIAITMTPGGSRRIEVVSPAEVTGQGEVPGIRGAQSLAP